MCQRRVILLLLLHLFSNSFTMNYFLFILSELWEWDGSCKFYILSKTKGYKHIFSFSHSTLFALKKTQYIKKPDKSPYNFGEKYKRLLNLFSNSAGNWLINHWFKIYFCMYLQPKIFEYLYILLNLEHYAKPRINNVFILKRKKTHIEILFFFKKRVFSENWKNKMHRKILFYLTPKTILYYIKVISKQSVWSYLNFGSLKQTTFWTFRCRCILGSHSGLKQYKKLHFGEVTLFF